jgi:hypothetical protein
VSIKRKPVVQNEHYEVNGKDVYIDCNENWIASVELTTQETNAFSNYKKAIINNPMLKKHTTATYKGS